MDDSDPTEARIIDRRREMLRVDHAGEYGAVAIYRGQLAVFERLAARNPGAHDRILGQVREMADQERQHLDEFNLRLRKEGVRPTLFAPLWDVAGFALGAATALMGEKAAHACTEAVETVISEHYGDQAQEFAAAGDAAMADRMAELRSDEQAHRDLAAEEGAHEAPGYALLSAAIRTGCRVAIRVAEKL